MNNIKYWVIDVDGTMTDGGIYYDEKGNEVKRFCVRDAAGFFAIHECGMKIIVLTGRTCVATERRMKELKVDYLFQKVENKAVFLQKFMRENGLSKKDMAYIGDDLNDYNAMLMCEFIACPMDSCKEVKERANYISKERGGYGAVRDVAEYVLRERGLWNSAIMAAYDRSHNVEED